MKLQANLNFYAEIGGEMTHCRIESMIVLNEDESKENQHVFFMTKRISVCFLIQMSY